MRSLEAPKSSPPPRGAQVPGYKFVTAYLARNAHQELAEILSAQEADEGPWSVLESLNHVFAIFDSSLADPGRDIAHEIPITRGKVRNDETAKRQPFGQDRSHQVRQEDRTR
jgi:hypothetical protein